MSLPTDLALSATALECYAACPRRFRHRYIDHTPASRAGTDPAGSLRRGDLFHKLVAWDGLGLDTSPILSAENDPELEELWSAYLAFRSELSAHGGSVQHDVVLTTRCGDASLHARLDALVTGGAGELTIYDWKTSHWPNHAKLEASPQSKVYPYVVWSAVSGWVEPARIELIYWFPAEPQDPVRIACDEAYLRKATEWLTASIETIAADTAFEMTPDRRTCSTCEYLAHCGVNPMDGDPLPLDEDYFGEDVADEELSYDHAMPWQ